MSDTCQGSVHGCPYVGSPQDVLTHQATCFFYLGRDFIGFMVQKLEQYESELVAAKETIASLQKKVAEYENSESKKKSSTVFQPTSIQDAIERKLCTFSFTSHKYAQQKLYSCKTCNFTKGLCICASCLDICHFGHEVYETIHTLGFCDCGINETSCACVTPSCRERSVVGHVELPSIASCVDKFVCTYSYTSDKHSTEQMWYECVTCGLTDTQGCCLVCVNTCHKGHEIKKVAHNSEFWCDCPSKGSCVSY